MNAKRFCLQGKQYFLEARNKQVMALWEQVWHYISSTYVVDDIEYIFISGDGANWIKSGVDYLPNAIFVLDRFHLHKCIIQVAGGNKGLHSKL